MTANNLPKPGLGKFCAYYMPGRGHYVVNPDRERVSIFFPEKAQADSECRMLQSRADAAKKRRVRPCLRCEEPFESEGVHNRMCNRCRNCGSNEEAAPFSFGTLHGRKRA